MQQSPNVEKLSVPAAIARDHGAKTGVCIICLEYAGWHYGNSHKYGKRKTLKTHRTGHASRQVRIMRHKRK